VWRESHCKNRNKNWTGKSDDRSEYNMLVDVYQSGDFISTYSLFKGAAFEDVRYSPRKLKALLVRNSFGGGPRKQITSLPMPFRSSEDRCQNQVREAVLSSLSGNSTTHFVVAAIGFLCALGVSTNGRFHPAGREPLFCLCWMRLGSICS
jgi:hypothetical protein